MTIFEQWWAPIEQMMNEKVPLNLIQTIYKEIYVNAIRDDRWKMYLNGLWVTLQVSFFAILFGTLLGTLLAVLRLPDVTELRLSTVKHQHDYHEYYHLELKQEIPLDDYQRWAASTMWEK